MNTTIHDTARADRQRALNSKDASRIYHRDKLAALPPTDDGSLRYSRSQARDIFEKYPEVMTVEYVTDGCKTSSQIIGRGDIGAPHGCYVIIASTGGKWGRSRRNFRPVDL